MTSANREIDERRHDGRERHEQPRKVHLRDELLAADHATPDAPATAVAEVRPRHERREREERVRHAVGRHVREAAEEDREDHHRHHRLEDGPRGAEHGLLVAHLDVAPDEEVQQLAVRARARARSSGRSAVSPARSRRRRWSRRRSRRRLLGSGSDRGRRAPTDGSSATAPGCQRAHTASGASGAIQPASAKSPHARPARTGRARRAIQRANGSVNPCFGAATIAVGSGRSSVPASSRLPRSRSGWNARSRPDALEQLVIDKRHAHFEPVRHRHHVESRSSCEPRYRRVSSRATAAGGRSGPAARAARARRPRACSIASRQTAASRSAGPASARDFSGQQESALHAIGLDQAAVGGARSGATAPAAARA